MSKPSNRSKTGLILPTAEEDAAINRGIAADPDTVEITDAMVAKMKPLARRGRPELDSPKESTTLRLDADMLEALRAGGKGWQTRVNAVLRDAWLHGKFTEETAA